MTEDKEQDPEEARLTREIEDGTYYAAARQWYSILFHLPIAERSYYAIIITLSIINFYFAFNALMGIFPLKVSIPFATYTENALEDWPRIHKLAEDPSENKNTAVMKYFLKQYVINRESYDLNFYELRYRNIWSTSTSDIFNIYKSQVAADNSLSPYHLYTNLAKRVITINEPFTYNYTNDISTAHITFTSSVISLVTKEELGVSRWQVDIKYKYTGFKVDQRLTSKNNVAVFFGLTENSVRENDEKSKFTPMSFVVTDYQLKELLE